MNIIRGYKGDKFILEWEAVLFGEGTSNSFPLLWKLL